MQSITNTQTEETDYIVAHQFLIGYVNNLTVPFFLGLIVIGMATLDKNTKISDSESKTILALQTHFFWMQLFQFVSAYIFVFVSYHNGPKWWSQGKCSYLNVMPIIFVIVFILGDLFTIPFIEFSLFWVKRSEIEQIGFANYFHLCGWLQLAFVIGVCYQLKSTIKDMFKKV
jgi:hypothetical protein